MLRILLLLLIAAVTGLKLFSFRHTPPGEEQVTLWLGAWTEGVNDWDGPLPEGRLIRLASGEGGFAFETLYLGAMEAAWLIVAGAVIGILLLGVLRPRFDGFG